MEQRSIRAYTNPERGLFVAARLAIQICDDPMAFSQLDLMIVWIFYPKYNRRVRVRKRP
jgi:hypothetical protein